MQTPFADILQQQTNPNSDNSNYGNNKFEKLIEREQIKGTPFWLIKQNDEYIIVMGRYKINHERIYTREAVDTFLKEELYNVISTIIFIVINEQATVKNL